MRMQIPVFKKKLVVEVHTSKRLQHRMYHGATTHKDELLRRVSFTDRFFGGKYDSGHLCHMTVLAKKLETEDYMDMTLEMILKVRGFACRNVASR